MCSHKIELPSDFRQRKVLKAFKRLGFVIDKKGGKGSHCKIIWPETNKSITIPKRIDKCVMRYILKEVADRTGISQEQFMKKYK